MPNSKKPLPGAIQVETQQADVSPAVPVVPVVRELSEAEWLDLAAQLKNSYIDLRVGETNEKLGFVPTIDVGGEYHQAALKVLELLAINAVTLSLPKDKYNFSVQIPINIKGYLVLSDKHMPKEYKAETILLPDGTVKAATNLDPSMFKRKDEDDDDDNGSSSRNRRSNRRARR
jgi:hypothetical protein